MKRQLELGLTQLQLAKSFGVAECTVTSWEKNRSNPTLKGLSKIVEFLGHILELRVPRSLGDTMIEYKRRRGINQETMAKRFGVDPTTLCRRERDESGQTGRLSKKVQAFIDGIGN